MKTALFLLVAVLCASRPADALSAGDFRARKQVKGWKEAAGTFEAFGPKKLYDLIDGGAPEYIDRGLREGVYQRLAGPRKLSAEVFAEDFGLPDRARSMLSSMKAGFDARLAVPGVDTALAFAFASVGGLSVYAARDKFYFEVLMTGKADTAVTLREAGKFLKFFSSRMGFKP